MKKSIALVLLSQLHVQAFLTHPAFVATTPTKQSNQGKEDPRLRSSERRMFMPMDISVVQSTQDLLSTSQQDLEAEVFADLAHIILDFGTVFSPDTLVLRLCILCGRVFAILSDYLPDGRLTPDEIVVQTSMLSLSSFKFMEMFLPVLKSASQTSSFKDRRIYQSVFRKAGFTLPQYKFLISNGSFEWIEAPANSTLFESGNNLLLTYRGAVCKVVKSSRPRSCDVYGRRNGRCSHDFIGDLSLAKELVDQGMKHQKISNQVDSSYATAPLQFFTTGIAGATLLRINTDRLLDSVQDRLVGECMKNLLFNAIQDRLEFLQATIEPTDSDESSSKANRTDESSSKANRTDESSSKANRTDASAHLGFPGLRGSNDITLEPKVATSFGCEYNQELVLVSQLVLF